MNQSRPKVSVIVIFYNPGQFFVEALASVFAQTLKDWELLLVDDGSDDESSRMARDCAGEKPIKVKYLEHQNHANLGMSASRNLGLSLCSGDFIAFLDADDVWQPTTLADQVELLQSHQEAAMVYGATQFWYSWTGREKDQRLDFIESPGVEVNKLHDPPALFTKFMQAQIAIPTGIMFRRAILERVGGYENAFAGMYEDQVFCAKVCLNQAVYVSGTSWYKYRQHPESCYARTLESGREVAYREVFLAWLDGYLAKQKIDDRETLRAHRREVWLVRRPGLYQMRLMRQRLQRQIKGSAHWLIQTYFPGPIRQWCAERYW